MSTTELTPGRVDLPVYEEHSDEHLEPCCHVIRQPPMTSAGTPPLWTLCGLVLKRTPHRLDLNAEVCPVCRRVRCPECFDRYTKGQR